MEDSFGNEVTCNSKEALELYNKAVEIFINMRGTCMPLLREAVALDSHFILARTLQGCMLCDVYSLPDDDTVQEYLSSLNGLYSKGTDREKKHIEAFRAHSKGNLPQAMEIFNQITMEYPKDFHAVKLAFNGWKSTGDFLRMRYLLARAVNACSPSLSIYPHLLGTYVHDNEMILVNYIKWMNQSQHHQYKSDASPEEIELCMNNLYVSKPLIHPLNMNYYHIIIAVMYLACITKSLDDTYPKPDISLYYKPFRYAFTLEETNERERAKELCHQGLSLDPINSWAIHSMAHVIEEAMDANEGIEFLSSTRHNWEVTLYHHHLVWHLCLYYLDLGKYDLVLSEFDNVMVPRLSTKSLLSLVDVCSLLWRLELVGVNPGEERWRSVIDAYKFRVYDGHRCFSWLETHLMMLLCHGKVSSDVSRLALARQVIKSMEDFSNDAVCSDCTVADVVGLPVCNALLAYGEEKYDEVLSLMLPLRYDFIKFGGSWAQRQVFEMTMIMGAINGKDWCHALSLITELKSRKPNSKLLQSLYETVLVKQSTETN